jgi:hypothetical protein
MLRVLKGESNGEEKDMAWSWKSGVDESTQPTREFREFAGDEAAASRARL